MEDLYNLFILVQERTEKPPLVIDSSGFIPYTHQEATLPEHLKCVYEECLPEFFVENGRIQKRTWEEIERFYKLQDVRHEEYKFYITDNSKVGLEDDGFYACEFYLGAPVSEKERLYRWLIG